MVYESIAPDVGRGSAKRRVRLDVFLETCEILPPHVAKIDVEGCEFQVVKGAAVTIRNHLPHIIFELSEGLPRHGKRLKDNLRWLSGLGDYSCEFAVGS